MANQIKDTDYLGLSTRIRAMEAHLLTRDRMEQLLEARTEEDTSKLLQESGFPDLDPKRPDAMDAEISRQREELLADLGESAPDPRFVDFFRLPYDYHNAKTILKGEAVGTDSAHMLSTLGRITPQALREAVASGTLDDLPGKLGKAVAEAREVLDTTRDPQLSDIVLDRWSYTDRRTLAAETGSTFLQGYVRLWIDGENLRSLVRTLRMGKNATFLSGVVGWGGDVDSDAILKVSANHGAGLAEVFASTPLEAAAEAGVEALKGGSLTAFEKLCDDAVAGYLESAKLIPFGEAPLVAFLAARETEFRNLRVLLLGKAAGLPADVIRSRLRAGYV